MTIERINLEKCEESIEEEGVENKQNLCKSCKPNENAIVPDWFNLSSGEFFKNERNCFYSIVWQSDIFSLQEDDIEERISTGIRISIRLLLQGLGKVDQISVVNELLDIVSIERFISTRPSLGIKYLFSIPVDIIDFIKDQEVVAPEQTPEGVAGSVYFVMNQAEFIINNVASILELYAIRYAVWSYTNNTAASRQIDFLSDSRNLRIAYNRFLEFLRRNEINPINQYSVEIFFDKNYNITNVYAKRSECDTPEELTESFEIFNEEPFNNSTIVSLFVFSPEIDYETSSRIAPNWIDIVQKYYYPPVNLSSNENDLFEQDFVICADNEPTTIDKIGRDIINATTAEVLSFPELLLNIFNEELCYDIDSYRAKEDLLNDPEMLLQRAIDISRWEYSIGDPLLEELNISIDQVGGNIKELWSTIVDRLGTCGLLSLFSSSIECITKGLSIDVSVPIIVDAAIKNLDYRGYEKIFLGLSPEQQLELTQNITNIYGDEHIIPWEYFRANGSATIFGGGNNSVLVGDFSDSARFTGTLGNPESNADAVNEIFNAYKQAIIELINPDELLRLLDNVPGAQLVKRALEQVDCSRPFIGEPSVEFLDVDICRGISSVTIPPSITLINIPGVLDAVGFTLAQVDNIIKDIATRLVIFTLKSLINAAYDIACSVIEGSVNAVVDFATGTDEGAQRNDFRSLFTDSLCDLEASDEDINELMGRLGNAVVGGEQQITPEDISSFIDDLGLILTQKELLDLLEGNSNDSILRMILELIRVNHPDLYKSIRTIDDIRRFFSSFGKVLNLDSLRDEVERLGAQRPANQYLCADSGTLQQFDDARKALLKGKGLNDEEIEEELNKLRDRLIEQLKNLVDKSTGDIFGENFPELISSDPKCPDGGILPVDHPSVIATQNTFIENTYSNLSKINVRDLVDDFGILDIILVDETGRGYEQQKRLERFLGPIVDLISPGTSIFPRSENIAQNLKDSFEEEQTYLLNNVIEFNYNNETELIYNNRTFLPKEIEFNFSVARAIDRLIPPLPTQVTASIPVDEELGVLLDSVSSSEEELSNIQIKKAAEYILQKSSKSNTATYYYEKIIDFSNKFINDLSVFVLEETEYFNTGWDSDGNDDVEEEAEVVFLKENAESFGGTTENPAYYIVPAIRKGWLRYRDLAVPGYDTDENLIYRSTLPDYEQLTDRVKKLKNNITDDERRYNIDLCTLELPYDKIIDKNSAASLDGIIAAITRTYIQDLFIKGLVYFSVIETTNTDVIKEYLNSVIKEDMIKINTVIFQDKKYYYAFLEQAVQTFNRKVQAGLITEVTAEESLAIDNINSEQVKISKLDRTTRIFSKDILWLDTIEKTEKSARDIFKKYLDEELTYITKNLKKILEKDLYSLEEILLSNDMFVGNISEGVKSYDANIKLTEDKFIFKKYIKIINEAGIKEKIAFSDIPVIFTEPRIGIQLEYYDSLEKEYILLVEYDEEVELEENINSQYDDKEQCLIKELINTPEFRLIFDYGINYKNNASLLGIHIANSFIPSINELEDRGFGLLSTYNLWNRKIFRNTLFELKRNFEAYYYLSDPNFTPNDEIIFNTQTVDIDGTNEVLDPDLRRSYYKYLEETQ